jgi:hypothetical protein
MENEKTEKTEQNSIIDAPRINASGIPVNEDGSFIKGVSGNPNGRPIGTCSIVEAIRRKLKEKPTPDDKKTYMEYIVDKVFKKALVDESERILIDIIDRVDGKAQQNIKYEEIAEDSVKSLADKLKSKDAGQRTKIIDLLDEIDREWEKETQIPVVTNSNDRGGDIQPSSEYEKLEDGEITPGMEQPIVR